MLSRSLIANASAVFYWLTLFLFLFFIHHPLWCTTFTVMNTNDSGANSLRQALADAAFDDIIEFDASLANQTITLTSGEIEVTRSITIDGTNAPNLTLSGNNSSRIFNFGWEFDSGVGANVPITIIVKNLKFIDGVALNTADTDDSYQLEGAGGAIFVLGVGNTITIENCTFDNNTSHGWGGGAVYLANAATATITDCIFTNNTTNPDNDEFDEDKGERGGTLASVGDGNLTVRNCEFRDNLAVNGAGLVGGDCNLLVEDCIFDNNNTVTLTRSYADHPDEALPDGRVFGMGAAIYTDGANRNETTKFQTVRRCTFTNNLALGNGGAIYMFGYDGDVFTVEDCTFTGNEVESESFSVFKSSMGGGMRIGGGGIGSRSGTLPPIEVYVRRCTFNDNTSQNQGGGLWTQITDGDNNTGGSIEIENCTFDNNRSYFGDFFASPPVNNATTSSPRGNGGGLSIDLRNNSTALLNNITVTNNVASWQAGGINLSSVTPPLTTIRNTISAYNDAENGDLMSNIAHNINSTPDAGGNNIISNEQGVNTSFLAMLSPSGTTIDDPLLDALADNGGTTETRALQAGSPAIDTGDDSHCINTDQRGFSRVGTCDIGAYEVSTILPIELLYFEAMPRKDHVALAWETASETNNLGFDIERSINGKKWINIGFIEGSSTTHEIKYYSFLDDDPTLGVNYYRLKQLDLDGAFEYSNIASVSYELKPNGQQNLAYPNPFGNQLTIEGTHDQLKNIRLINVFGQDVTSLVSQGLHNDKQILLETSTLQAGWYFIQTSTSTIKALKLD